MSGIRLFSWGTRFRLDKNRYPKSERPRIPVRPCIDLIIHIDEKGNPSPIDNLCPRTLARQLFRTPVIMTAINQPGPSPKDNTPPSLPWLSDVSKAAQRLTSLTLESSAQAALITVKNDLWAYAGGLSQNAAKEAAQTVIRNWDGQKGSDLLKFIRLDSTNAEHVLYATPLAADTMLAFIFDAETPFSTIRTQASQLANDFGSEQTKSDQPPEPAQQIDFDFLNDMDEDNSLDVSPLSNIFANLPVSNSAPASTHDFDLPPKKEKSQPNQTRISEPLSNAPAFNREVSPSVQLNKVVMKDQPQAPDTSAQPGIPMGEVGINAASLNHLTYACLFIPRFSTHYLTGDLADRLGEWLPTICIAFGWRLEFLAVRPEYLQWVVNVQPNKSPDLLMRIMRKQTSEKIFDEFIRLKKENLSGDFWAPGYLIMGGSQPHPPHLVRDFIQRTRQAQGQNYAPVPPRGYPENK